MAVSVVSFLFSWCSTGGPGAQLFVECWPSLPHLRPDVSLPTISHLSPSPTLTGTVWFLSWLSYIIVQRPLSRLLDFWNRMLDPHQAEITVIGVHRSLSSGASVYECTIGIFFTSPYFISRFPPTRFPLITAVRICHLLPVHHLGMAFLAGSKVKIQQFDTEKKNAALIYIYIYIYNIYKYIYSLFGDDCCKGVGGWIWKILSLTYFTLANP